MRRFLQIVWDNLFIKTFDFKGRTNRSDFQTCRSFSGILIFLSILFCVFGYFEIEFIVIIGVILGFFAFYLQLIPFTSLRVRRLHDIGEPGSTLIMLYIAALIIPGLGCLWLMSHMDKESLVCDKSESTDNPQATSIETNIEIEDVEL